MFERNFPLCIKIDGSSGRQHSSVELKKFSRIRVCPNCKTRDSTNELEGIFKGFSNSLTIKFSAEFGRGLRVGTSNRSGLSFYLFKLFTSHETDDWWFEITHRRMITRICARVKGAVIYLQRVAQGLKNVYRDLLPKEPEEIHVRSNVCRDKHFY